MANVRSRINLLYFSYLVCIGCFLFGEVIRIPLSPSIVMKPLDLSVAGLFILWLVSKPTIELTLVKPIGIFLTVGLISLVLNGAWLTNSQMIAAFAYLFRFTAYLSLYCIVQQFNPAQKNTIQKLFVWTGVVVLVLGFFQYMYYPDLRNLYYLGWDEHLHRLFSIFLDPNFAAAFLVLFFLFLIICKKSKLLLIATPIGILLTYSRSGLLMLVVSVTTYLVLSKRYVLIGAVGGLLIIYLVLASLFFKTENTNLFRTASSFSRIDSAQDALTIFKSSPVIGVGFNTYVYAKQKLGLLKPNKFENHASATTDTSLLFVLATTGVVGLGSFVYLVCKIYYLLFNRMKTKKLALVLFCFLTGLLVDSLVINSLFYSFILFWFWSFLGIIERD